MKEIRELSPEQMKDVCSERTQDIAVRTRLYEILGGVVLPQIMDGVRVTLSPYLATPIAGVKYAVEALQGYGIPCVLCTYPGDKFTTSNEEKAGTLRPTILRTISARAGKREIVERPRIYRGNIGNLEGYPIGNIQSVFSELTVGDYYDRLFKELVPGIPIVNFDQLYGDLVKSNFIEGKTPAEIYYYYIMAINQVFGAGLNAGGNEDEGFYKRTVEPAIMRASRDLGVEPISLSLDGMPKGKEARYINIGRRTFDGLNQSIGAMYEN